MEPAFLGIRISGFVKERGPEMGLSENWGVPYNQDPTIKGTILGSPIFGHPQWCAWRDVEGDGGYFVGSGSSSSISDDCTQLS